MRSNAGNSIILLFLLIPYVVFKLFLKKSVMVLSISLHYQICPSKVRFTKFSKMTLSVLTFTKCKSNSLFKSCQFVLSQLIITNRDDAPCIIISPWTVLILTPLYRVPLHRFFMTPNFSFLQLNVNSTPNLASRRFFTLIPTQLQ